MIYFNAGSEKKKKKKKHVLLTSSSIDRRFINHHHAIYIRMPVLKQIHGRAGMDCFPKSCGIKSGVMFSFLFCFELSSTCLTETVSH